MDVAFGVRDTRKLVPKWEDIPKEFKGMTNNNKWCEFVSTWFCQGVKDLKWSPKAGIKTSKALAHLKVIMGSYDLAHEHKEASAAFLLSEWFDDVTYVAAKKA